MTELVLECDAVEERALVEQYVARTLDEENVRAFEIHYLGCASCQANVLAAASAREALRTPPRRYSRHVPLGIAGFAVAAALAAVLLIPRRSAHEPLTRLGTTLEPPVYLGVPIRDTGNDSIFVDGMSAYSRRDFRAAAAMLARVTGSGAVPAAFFRGSSLLMTGKPVEAAADFSKVIAAGPSPYLSEAHFYRAKAHLLNGRADEALADLTAASADSAISVQARLLADSIRGLSPR